MGHDNDLAARVQRKLDSLERAVDRKFGWSDGAISLGAAVALFLWTWGYRPEALRGAGDIVEWTLKPLAFYGLIIASMFLGVYGFKELRDYFRKYQ